MAASISRRPFELASSNPRLRRTRFALLHSPLNLKPWAPAAEPNSEAE